MRKYKKIKLTSENTLDAEYSQRHDSAGMYSLKNHSTSQAVIHPDVKEQFKKMAAHVAIICDMKEEMEVNKKHPSKTDDIHTDKILVNGIVIGGSGDDEGFAMIAQKILLDKILNITTPFMRWAEYAYAQDLGAVLDKLISEAELYFNGEKFAERQEVIEFPEEATVIEMNSDVLEKATKKKRAV